MTTYLVAGSAHHPEERITNAELERRTGVTSEWIETHLGIRERRRAPADQRTSDLGRASLEQALARADWSADTLDLLLCATTTPDALVPSTACLVAAALGISPPSFDLNAACSGFVYGLGVACAMIGSGRFHRVALVAAENYTRFTDADDRDLSLYWGDGAATVLLQDEPCAGALEVVDWDLAAMTDGGRWTSLPLTGSPRQDPRRVKQYAVRGFVESARGLLARNAVSPAELTAFVGHQANLRLLERVVDELGIPRERHWHTIERLGNCGVAGAPATLVAHMHRTPLRAGDLVLLTVVGAGFTTGSVLLRGVGGP